MYHCSDVSPGFWAQMFQALDHSQRDTDSYTFSSRILADEWGANLEILMRTALLHGSESNARSSLIYKNQGYLGIALIFTVKEGLNQITFCSLYLSYWPIKCEIIALPIFSYLDIRLPKFYDPHFDR